MHRRNVRGILLVFDYLFIVYVFYKIREYVSLPVLWIITPVNLFHQPSFSWPQKKVLSFGSLPLVYMQTSWKAYFKFYFHHSHPYLRMYLLVIVIAVIWGLVSSGHVTLTENAVGRCPVTSLGAFNWGRHVATSAGRVNSRNIPKRREILPQTEPVTGPRVRRPEIQKQRECQSFVMPTA